MLLRECSYFIVGGAGFIGSHFTDVLLASPLTRRVTLFDNFSSGREWHFEHHRNDPRLKVIRADASDVNALTATMDGHDWVIHLASNPDIALAVENPEIDFYRGTLLTNNVVEAMRRANVRRLIYASGSGVYGDAGDQVVAEDFAPLCPVSTYGASKLAGESLIASYCSMFGLRACVFRFGNVVGARQTHGVGFDFLRRLSAKPNRLRILGDGRQSKPYIHVSDVVGAVLCAADKATAPFSVFNVATDDAVSVTEIAELAVAALGLPANPAFAYTGGRCGWRGDVPVLRLNSSRIRSLGWVPKWNSREAVCLSLQEISADERTLRS
ncbi:MAG TPA: NAD-dependent epimerase/dehydratase family protein [Acidobacteriaceae bacterium]|jgi:UDP-glucose 4-epimerase|nr:NAD-dependent epimerase/dehydratase family protein [Acidobacteriaceae bacterium]